MNQKEFSEKYHQARYNATGGITKTHLITTFFDKKEGYKLPEIAEDIKRNNLGPFKDIIDIKLTYTNNKITTYDGTSDGNNEMSYGVYDSE